jgi:hypothetical protein
VCACKTIILTLFKISDDGISRLRLFASWTVSVDWRFKINKAVRRN